MFGGLTTLRYVNDKELNVIAVQNLHKKSGQRLGDDWRAQGRWSRGDSPPIPMVARILQSAQGDPTMDPGVQSRLEAAMLAGDIENALGCVRAGSCEFPIVAPSESGRQWSLTPLAMALDMHGAGAKAERAPFDNFSTQALGGEIDAHEAKAKDGARQRRAALRLVDALLEAGADPNAKCALIGCSGPVDDRARPAWTRVFKFHDAGSPPFGEEPEPSEAAAIEAAKRLAKHGWSRASVDDNGKGPLHWAAARNYPELAKYLLGLGWRAAAMADFGELPHEVASQHGRRQLARDLFVAMESEEVAAAAGPQTAKSRPASRL
jgi:hypothetical protein